MARYSKMHFCRHLVGTEAQPVQWGQGHVAYSLIVHVENHLYVVGGILHCLCEVGGGGSLSLKVWHCLKFLQKW